MAEVSVRVKRTDLGEISFEPKCFCIPKELDCDAECLKKCMADVLEMQTEDAPFKIFKLRNAKGALIPLTYIYMTEDPHEPLNLEITNCRQTTLIEDHLHNLTQLKDSIKKRVDYLEGQVPHILDKSRDEDILRQVHELTSEVRGLSQKIDAIEASSSSAPVE